MGIGEGEVASRALSVREGSVILKLILRCSARHAPHRPSRIVSDPPPWAVTGRLTSWRARASEPDRAGVEAWRWSTSARTCSQAIPQRPMLSRVTCFDPSAASSRSSAAATVHRSVLAHVLRAAAAAGSAAARR